MAKHMQILEDACERLWDDLEKLNKSAPDPAKDAEQYHRIMSAIADSVGIKMAEEAEEDGYSTRRGMPRGGYSGIYWGPQMYGNAYRGNSYGDDWAMGGMSEARGQRRDNMGRYSRNDGYSMHDAEKQEMLRMLRRNMDDAPERDREIYRRFIGELENMH